MSDHHQILAVLQSGLGPATGAFALLLNRLFLGLFFAMSGFHKLFNKGRHAQLVVTLESSHIPLVRINQWWVPAVELLGGIALVAGILAPLAALALTVECVVAVATDGWKRIASYRPIDKADWLDDLLYLPETLAIAALLVIVGLGPGAVTAPELFSW